MKNSSAPLPKKRKVNEYNCIVRGCDTRIWEPSPKRKLFRLPKDEVGIHHWLTAVKREDLLDVGNMHRIRVCELHFHGDMFCAKKSKLQDGALPCLVKKAIIKTPPTSSQDKSSNIMPDEIHTKEDEVEDFNLDVENLADSSVPIEIKAEILDNHAYNSTEPRNNAQFIDSAASFNVQIGEKSPIRPIVHDTPSSRSATPYHRDSSNPNMTSNQNSELILNTVNLLARQHDEHEIFGRYVASALRLLQSPHNQKKLRRLIEASIYEISGLDDNEDNVPTSTES